MTQPLRWGIAGCGDIANKRVAPAINAHPDCELSAFFSGTGPRAEEFASRHGAERGFDDYDDFISSGLDCVYVASRVCDHEGQTIRALNAGLHVLCEKPMALNSAECERMITAAEKAGKKLGVSYYRRLYPAWRRAVEIVRSGEIGDIVAIRLLLSSFWNMREDDPKHWRVQRALSGGGPLADVGAHRLDLLVDMAGPPVSLVALTDCREHDWDVEDTSAILMQLRGGAHATAIVSGCADVRRDDFDIFGTRGAVSLPGLGSSIVVEAERKKRTEEAPLPENVHYPLIDDFVEAVVTGREPVCSGVEGAKTTRILDAVFESSARQLIVPFEGIR